MSTPESAPPIDRALLLNDLRHAVRANSNVAIMLHHTISERIGISAVEQKTLDQLERHGPLTAGELVQHTGLAAASVTSLIDRLEKKGFVRRVRDTTDRRRVIVELNHERLSEFAYLFEPLIAILDDLFPRYTDDQLATILDFVDRATQAALGEVTKLNTAGQRDSANL